MFLDKKEKGEIEKPQKQQAVVGYDLSAKIAQISYFLPGSNQPETVSQVAGEEDFLIPALLARQVDKELWLFGKEALSAVADRQAEPVENLLERAAIGKPVVVGQESFDPVALLSLFIKRSLSLLTPVLHPDRIHAFVFTVEKVEKPVVDALLRAAALLEYKQASYYVVGRGESFFYYNIHQPGELWRQDVLLCDLSADYLFTFLFCLNRKTTPMAALVEEASFDGVRSATEGREEGEGEKIMRDKAFCEALLGLLDGRQISSVYLIGSGFFGEWYREALQILCKDRRVFLGSNLYSKGACYAGRERLAKNSASEGCVYLGKDMLKANVGMHVLRRGTDAYLALLDAGVNWYEAKRTCDFLLEEENSFSLRITPVDGKEIREVQITLAGLPKRPKRTARIRLSLEMADVKTVRITMEDLGFGEFFPATHGLWEETFGI